MEDSYTRKANCIIKQCVNELSFLWEAEPLESDQTTEIAEMFQNELDILNGNIHKDDYEAAVNIFDLEYIDPNRSKEEAIGNQVIDINNEMHIGLLDSK